MSPAHSRGLTLHEIDDAYDALEAITGPDNQADFDHGVQRLRDLLGPRPTEIELDSEEDQPIVAVNLLGDYVELLHGIYQACYRRGTLWQDLFPYLTPEQRLLWASTLESHAAAQGFPSRRFRIAVAAFEGSESIPEPSKIPDLAPDPQEPQSESVEPSQSREPTVPVDFVDLFDPALFRDEAESLIASQDPIMVVAALLQIVRQQREGLTAIQTGFQTNVHLHSQVNASLRAQLKKAEKKARKARRALR
jgi:hypothetical protein